jgi:hypothetical protein
MLLEVMPLSLSGVKEIQALPISEVYGAMETGPEGLSGVKAKARLKIHGHNTLKKPPQEEPVLSGGQLHPPHGPIALGRWTDGLPGRAAAGMDQNNLVDELRKRH